MWNLKYVQNEKKMTLFSRKYEQNKGISNSNENWDAKKNSSIIKNITNTINKFVEEVVKNCLPQGI